MARRAAELRRIGDHNWRAPAAVRYSASPDAAEKDFVNAAVNRAFKRLGPPARAGVALALDAEDFRTTRALARQLGRGLRVRLAQHDPAAHAAMRRAAPAHANLDALHPGDYGELDRRLPPRSVALDHADFCGTWRRARVAMLSRLRAGVYRHRALVRVTVCARDRKRTDEDAVAEILEDYRRAARGSGYRVRALPLREWAVHPDLRPAPEQVAYAYGKRMITLLIVVLQTR